MPRPTHNVFILTHLVCHRPLPEEMLNYARSDTHFLLFIYDNLRNALIDRAQSRTQSPAGTPQPQASASSSSWSGEPSGLLVREVLSRSEGTALRVYEREIYDTENGTGPGGWDTLARKWNKGSLMATERDNERKRVYRSVHAWRDRVAREEDESTRCVFFHLIIWQCGRISTEIDPMGSSVRLC